MQNKLNKAVIARPSLLQKMAYALMALIIISVSAIPQPKAKAWVGFLPIGFEIAMMAFEVMAGAANKSDTEPITTDIKVQESLQDSIVTSFALTYTMLDQVSKRARIAAGLESGRSTYTLDDYKGQYNNLSSSVAVSLLKSKGKEEPEFGVNYWPQMPNDDGKWTISAAYPKIMVLNGQRLMLIQTWPVGSGLSVDQGKGVLQLSRFGSSSVLLPSSIYISAFTGTNDQKFAAAKLWWESYLALPATDFWIEDAPTIDVAKMRDADYGMVEQMITVPPVTAFTPKVKATGEKLKYDWSKGTYTKAATGQAYTPAADESDVKWVAPPVVKQTVNGKTEVGTTVKTSTGDTKFVNVTKPDTAVPPLDAPLTLSDFAISLPAGRTKIEMTVGGTASIPVTTVPAAVGLKGLGWSYDEAEGIITVGADGTITGLREGVATLSIGALDQVISKVLTLEIAVGPSGGGGGPPNAPNILLVFLDLLRAILMYLYRMFMFILGIPLIPAVPLTNTAMDYFLSFTPTDGNGVKFFGGGIPVTLSVHTLVKTMISVIMSFTVYKVIKRFF